LKLFQEWGGWRIKESGGGGKFKHNIFDTFKNFCKCYNVSLPSTTIKKKFISSVNQIRRMHP
jgi:hypothetical protein